MLVSSTAFPSGDQPLTARSDGDGGRKRKKLEVSKRFGPQ